MAKQVQNPTVETVEQTPVVKAIGKPEFRIITAIWEIKKLPYTRKYGANRPSDAPPLAEGFAGKSYRMYVYNDIVFNVHEDDDFNRDFDARQVVKVKVKETLIPGEEKAQLALTNYQDLKGAINEAKVDALLNYFKSTSFKPTEEDFSALG